MYARHAGLNPQMTIAPRRTERADPAITRIHSGERARFRLVCFPGAGASASVFRFWRSHGAPEFHVDVVQPRGLSGPARSRGVTLDARVADAAETLAREARDDEELVLFGHSFGALVAYEVAQALSLTDAAPAHLMVAARAAPHMAPHPHLVADMSDAALASALRDLGLDDRHVLAHPALGAHYLGAMREDLRENAAYIHLHDAPLDCPVTAFSGRKDPLASPLAMANWQRHTTGAFRHFRLGGGHFFPGDRPARLSAIIRALLGAKG